MKSNYKQLFLIFIILLICIFDFYDRFAFQVGNKLSANNIPELKVLNSPIANDKELTFIKNQLNLLKEQSSKQNRAEINISSVQQSMQSGKLTMFYNENQRITLKAIISNRELIALIALDDLVSGKRKIIQLINGQVYKGFIVNLTNKNAVLFSKGEQNIELVMYTNSGSIGK